MPLSPNVPIPRNPFVDRQGILTKEGLYFLYQTISAALGIDALDADTANLTARMTAIESLDALHRDTVPDAQDESLAILGALQRDTVPARQNVDDVLAAFSVGVRIDPRVKDLEVLAWL